MSDDLKEHAKELANIRGMVRRVCPEYFREDVSIEAAVAELAKEEKQVYRSVTENERMELCQDFVFLDERLGWLHEQKKLLKAKFRQIDRDIDEEITDVINEKQRLLDAIRNRVIRVPVSEVEERAAAPTSMMTPSEALREVQTKAGE